MIPSHCRRRWFSIGGAFRLALISIVITVAPIAASHAIKTGGDALREVVNR